MGVSVYDKIIEIDFAVKNVICSNKQRQQLTWGGENIGTNPSAGVHYQ